MSLQDQIMAAIKDAMKAKNRTALTALRAVKSAILLAQTESGAASELTEEQELKILQKQVKQRKDSAAIFIKQGREDLATPELAEAEVIGQFLPEALTLYINESATFSKSLSEPPSSGYIAIPILQPIVAISEEDNSIGC